MPVVAPKRPKIFGYNNSNPLWKGPTVDGITQSMMNSFLACRERFRIRYIDGLQTTPRFNTPIEYGQMWHTCEEALARKEDWEKALMKHGQNLARQYRGQQEQVDYWYRACKVQFPLYVKHWRSHPDVKGRVPIVQEHQFEIPYELPKSGVVIKLKGKWDALDLIKNEGGVFVQENKTKSSVDTPDIMRQLTFDLQTMTYMVSAVIAQQKKIFPFDKGDIGKIKGVRYNVIRRPLSGGKGSIRQHKPSKKNPSGETLTEMFERLTGILKDCPKEQFSRFLAVITPGDVTNFREQFLDPFLTSVGQWYEGITGQDLGFDPHYEQSWRHPFGVYNPTDEGFASDLDEYLRSGSTSGLERVHTVFPELGSLDK